MTVIQDVLAAMAQVDIADATESGIVARATDGTLTNEHFTDLGSVCVTRWREAFGLDSEEAIVTSFREGSRLMHTGLGRTGFAVTPPALSILDGLAGGAVLHGIRIGLLIADRISQERRGDA